ncbi:hypothetical protein JXD38_03685, partial [candidate division WOR-3 bacterium]|nr:hypothetical protein [candidate division WOR-3 bacterium]
DCMLSENVRSSAGRSALLFLLLLLATAQAQITLTSTDIPTHLNDTFLYKRNSGVATVNVGSSGGPHAWTFDTSTFVGARQYQTVVDKNTTPFGPLFPAANVAYATEGESTLINAYTFFQLSPSEFDCEGMGLEFTDTLLDRVYEPHQVTMPLPLAYGQSWHCTYGWSDTMLPLVITTNVVEWHRIDAWGTVTTPCGTDSCLRENLVDTIVVTTYVSGVPISTDSTWRRHYNWYIALRGIAASARGPERDTSLVFTSSDCYRVMVDVQAGIEEQNPAGKSSPAPCATLVRGILRLPQPLSEDPQTELALLDLSGRTVLRVPQSSRTADVSGLAHGIHFLLRTSPAGRTVVQKYVLVE